MNERVLAPANVAAAALVIAGAAVVLVPRHAPTIARVLVVGVAAAAAIHALVASAPPTWWPSPFDRGMPDDGEEEGPDELAWIRGSMARRRQRIGYGPPVPPDTLRLLKPLVEAALQREGLDVADGAERADRAERESVRVLLSPLTWSILTADPMARPGWFRTVRSDQREVAGVVHAVLDELEGLADGRAPSPPQVESTHPGAI